MPMKRIWIVLFAALLLPQVSPAQVINFGKTLPVRSFSLTAAPVYNVDNVFHWEQAGMSYLVMAGYGFTYNLDMSAKYGYYNGADYFGVDLQYLFRETRQSYYSLYGGVHKWDEYGVDATVTYTYTPQYWANLSIGLDLDVDISVLELRAWVPLNFGINIDDRYFIYLEYNLPATEEAWDILGGGVTFIFR